MRISKLPNDYASLYRALGLLGHFSSDRPELSITLLARLSGMHKSTVSRLARVFEAAGFIDRDPATRRYRLGLRLYELGSLYLRGASLYGIAASALPELSQQSGHTSYLGVLDGQDMVTLEMCPGTNPLQVVVSPGERIPAHVAAGGKAVLASLAESRLIELYPRKLPRFTRATIPTLAALKAELEAIRRRGYAVANGEWTESIASVGVALRGSPSDRPIGVSLAFPAYRVSRREVEELADLLLRKAREIEAKSAPRLMPRASLQRRRG